MALEPHRISVHHRQMIRYSLMAAYWKPLPTSKRHPSPLRRLEPRFPGAKAPTGAWSSALVMVGDIRPSAAVGTACLTSARKLEECKRRFSLRFNFGDGNDWIKSTSPRCKCCIMRLIKCVKPI